MSKFVNINDLTTAGAPKAPSIAITLMKSVEHGGGAEAALVFVGTRADGTANWQCLRPRHDGSFRPGKVPGRFERVLRSVARSNEEIAA